MQKTNETSAPATNSISRRRAISSGLSHYCYRISTFPTNSARARNQQLGEQRFRFSSSSSSPFSSSSSPFSSSPSRSSATLPLSYGPDDTCAMTSASMLIALLTFAQPSRNQKLGSSTSSCTEHLYGKPNGKRSGSPKKHILNPVQQRVSKA